MFTKQKEITPLQLKFVRKCSLLTIFNWIEIYINLVVPTQDHYWVWLCILKFIFQISKYLALHKNSYLSNTSGLERKKCFKFATLKENTSIIHQFTPSLRQEKWNKLIYWLAIVNGDSVRKLPKRKLDKLVGFSKKLLTLHL